MTSNPWKEPSGTRPFIISNSWEFTRPLVYLSLLSIDQVLSGLGLTWFSHFHVFLVSLMTGQWQLWQLHALPRWTILSARLPDTQIRRGEQHVPGVPSFLLWEMFRTFPGYELGWLQCLSCDLIKRQLSHYVLGSKHDHLSGWVLLSVQLARGKGEICF